MYIWLESIYTPCAFVCVHNNLLVNIQSEFISPSCKAKYSQEGSLQLNCCDIITEQRCGDIITEQRGDIITEQRGDIITEQVCRAELPPPSPAAPLQRCWSRGSLSGTCWRLLHSKFLEWNTKAFKCYILGVYCPHLTTARVQGNSLAG